MKTRAENPGSTFDSQRHWFSIGDCCLAVIESAPSVEFIRPRRHSLFFLHGRFGQSEMWHPLVEKLSPHFRCFQIDLPGFGRSFSVRGSGYSLLEQAALLKHVVRSLVPRQNRAVLVGHDIGGAIAQLCAVQEPETVSGLVLINSSSLTHPVSDLRTGWLCLQARRKLQKLLSSLPRALDDRLQDLLARAWEDRYRRASMRHAFEAWERTWPGPFERKTWKDEIRRLRQPVLLLWGSADSLNPPERADELMRALPEAYLFLNEGCGHWPCLEDDAWVDHKLREYLFRLEARHAGTAARHRAGTGRAIGA